jgi:hypothetical protein
MILGAALCALAGSAQAQDAPPPPLKFFVGSASVTLPAPDTTYIEAGDRLRPTFFKYLVPSENKLIAAFIEKSYLVKLGEEGQTGGPPASYAMVQVSRMADATLFDANEFRTVIRNIPAPYSTLLQSTPAAMHTDLLNRVHELTVHPLSPGRVRPLGAFFSKTDAAGFGVIRHISGEGQHLIQAQGTLFLHVRGKVLFAYIYTEYKGPETATQLAKATEAWADAILAANK